MLVKHKLRVMKIGMTLIKIKKDNGHYNLLNIFFFNAECRLKKKYKTKLNLTAKISADLPKLESLCEYF